MNTRFPNDHHDLNASARSQAFLSQELELRLYLIMETIYDERLMQDFFLRVAFGRSGPFFIRLAVKSFLKPIFAIFQLLRQPK